MSTPAPVILTGTVAFLGDDGSTFGDGDDRPPVDRGRRAQPPRHRRGRRLRPPPGTSPSTGAWPTTKTLAVGRRRALLTLAGQVDATIVGITAFGDSDSIDSGGTVALPEATAFDWLSSGIVEYEDLYLRGAGDQQALADAVSAARARRASRPRPGPTSSRTSGPSSRGFGRVLKTGLQFFAMLALFVGGFVIYNTFTVIVAQRQREIAVLSAIGATPKQIKRSLRFEGLTVGLLGSALGVVAGVGLTFVLVAVLDAVGVALPGSGIKVAAAERHPGMLRRHRHHLRLGHDPGPPGRSDRADRGPAGRRGREHVVLPVAGWSPPSCSSVSAQPVCSSARRAASIGLGGLALFIGVIVSGPFLAVGGARLLKPLLSRVGLEGQLAVDNAARNPQRTATTAERPAHRGVPRRPW